MLQKAVSVVLTTVLIISSSPVAALAQTTTPNSVPTESPTTTPSQKPAVENPSPEPASTQTEEKPIGKEVPPPAELLSGGEDDPSYGPERNAEKSTLKLEPDKFDGSLSYEYPIESPPGRNGLDPKLSLVYSSKNTDDTSAFGYGWSTNIPYIERINRKGLNRMFTDNYYFSSLDGEVVASSTVANTEDYGPLVENGDFRIYQFKDRSFWRVTDKLGTIYTFGVASTSQLVNMASSTQVYRWYLDEVRDANGNYITYTYAKDDAAIYPSSITYTHNTSTAGIYEIAFSRETRPSAATSSVSGFPVVWRDRVSEIRVNVNDVWTRKYALAYMTGDNASRPLLANVTETGRTEGGASSNTHSFDLESSSSQYVYHADASAYDVTGNLTIEAWVKFETLPSSGNSATIVGKYKAGSTSDRSYQFSVNNNSGTYELALGISSDGVDNPSAWGGAGTLQSTSKTFSGLVVDTWYHVAVTYSTVGIAEFFVNGSSIGSQAGGNITSLHNSASKFTAGALENNSGTPANFLDGFIDDVRVWSTARSGVQIADTYDEELGGTEANLNAYYKLNNNYEDGTANNNDLTSSGSPSFTTDVPAFNGGTGASIALPATVFSYASSTPGFTRDTSWVMPTYFVDDVCAGNGDMGVRFDDFNGDGWTDIMQGYNTTKNLYSNNWNGSWSTTTPSGMDPFVTSSCYDLNLRTGDVDGDSLPDLIAGDANGDYVRTNTGRGTSFNSNGWGDVTIDFTEEGGPNYDVGGRLLDINGDGLLDLVAAYDAGNPEQAAQNGIYLNNGAGWDATTTYAWTLPNGVYFAGNISGAGADYGVRFADFNGDGLTDIMQGFITGSAPYVRLYLNDGDGTWTTVIPNIQFPFTDGAGADQRVRIADVNGDGLADIVRTDQSAPVYLNKDGGATFSSASWGTLPVDFVYDYGDGGARFVDINGDGLIDIVKSNGNSEHPGTGANGAYLHEATKPDLLRHVTTKLGGTISVAYKATPKFADGGSNANPVLSLVQNAVEAIGTSDGLGTTGTTTYAYGGGEYYYADEFNRKFASFATTTVTDPLGYIAKIYSHQGNGTQSSLGEYSDDDSKIGKPYRVDVTDENGNVYQRVVTKWENSSLSNSRDWVKKTRETTLSYDGNGDHKDKAETYAYDPVNANILAKSEYGEVSGSDDGSFSDSGTDKRTTTYTYAASSTLWTLGLPKQETLTNNASSTIADKKFYYDTLSHGSATKGNLTKEEHWVTSGTWIDTEKTYDGLGLVVQEKDPRDKATNYVYDSYKLRIATSTNAAGHITEFYRDLSSGKVTKALDPNSRSWETAYDGLDRPLSEKIPDHLGTPTNTVLKTEYAYTDTVGSRKVLQTDYLNAATTTLKYTYLDGLGRVVQERRQAETSPNYVVLDFVYNMRGDLGKQSLPYFGSGVSKSAATTSPYMLTTYSYDPLKRITAETNILGTATSSYDQWKQTITDREGNVKDFTSDAFGNLMQVDERYATTTFSTAYTYDALNNLTKITDAYANLRNFTYDGISRLTSSEDLHTSGDVTFGTRSFTYDAAGNIATTTDAKAQTIEYTYDDINRALTENYSGDAGTEITYAYDSCANGVGRMCSATTTVVATQLAYDALGNVSTERKTIDSTTYLTTYARDRLGNITSITHPNNAVTSYVYNAAGLPETISFLHTDASTSTSVLTNLDYAPTGEISEKDFYSGAVTLYDFDASDLYRLHNLRTYASSTSSTGSAGNDNTHSTDIERSSSQSWSITDGSQVGLDVVGDITLSVWVKWESLPQAGSQEQDTVAKYGTAGDESYLLYFYWSNDNHMYMYMQWLDSDSYSARGCQIDGVLSTGTWFHIAGTVDVSSDTGDVYIDGSRRTTNCTNYQNNTTSILDTSAPFRVGGSDNSPGHHFDGLMDETLVYNADIGSAGVSSLYSDPAHPSTTNLVSRWAFDNNGDDDHGSNDLTANNSPTFTMDIAFEGSTSASSTTSTSTPIQSVTYEYDDVGNITQITDYSTTTGKIILFDYDDLYRLTFASSTAASSTPFRESYGYSAVGNMTEFSTTTNATSTYAYVDGGYNNPHAASAVGNASYSYDRNGNLLSNGTSNYGWDYRDRLTSATSTTATTTFGYDYNGQRVISQTASSTTVFPSKYFSITSTQVGSSTLATSTSYVFANEQLVAYVEQDLIDSVATGTPRTFYVHSDHLGSTNVISDENGDVYSVRDYLPFGSTRVESGPQSFGRGYIGEFQDSNDFSYLNNRYYRSSQGQFISEDPTFLAIGDPVKLQQLSQDQQKLLADPQQLNSGRTMGGSNSGFASGWRGNTQSRAGSISQAEWLADPQMQNSYAYARGNPITMKDPEGLWGVFFQGDLSGAAGLGSGFAGQGSAGGGFVTDRNPFTDTTDIGGYTSYGGLVGGAFHSTTLEGSRRGPNPYTVLGLSGGLSGGVTLTNATRMSQLDGRGVTNTLTLGIGSISWSVSKSGVWTISAALGFEPAISFSVYPTDTKTGTAKTFGDSKKEDKKK